MQKDFELKSTEQINAVVANMEVETDRMKDEFLAVHEQVKNVNPNVHFVLFFMLY